MLYALLLLAPGAAPPYPDVVTLEDARRFSNFSRAEAEEKLTLVWMFRAYAVEKGLDRERLAPLKVVGIYSTLRAINDPSIQPSTRLAALRILRQGMGKAAYQEGRLPPPYPKEHEKGFKQWMAEMKAKGLTLDDIHRLQKERLLRELKEKREQKPKK
jgi:hypothetical protein